MNRPNSPEPGHDPSPSCPRLAEGFTLAEKIWAQTSFILMGVLGTIGIARAASWPWLLPYLAVYWYGVPGGIMRHLACPRCDHLHVYGDCLQFPPTITRRLVKTRKRHAFSPRERLLFLCILLGCPLYPLPFLAWVRWQPWLLAGFAVCALAWYGGQLLYFCTHCRVESCPFNRTGRPCT